MNVQRAQSTARRGRATSALGLWLLCILSLLSAGPALAEAPTEMLKVYAHTLQHRSAKDAMALIRPQLTNRGTIEEQPGSNTLVFRDTVSALAKVKATLTEFDRPPENLRLDIQVVKAGPKTRSIISPPSASAEQAVAELPEDLENRLRNLLRYEDYRVLAKAGVSSKEGDEVTYSLGERYDVSFKLGSVMGERRLKLEDFKIVKKIPATNKGRRLPPRQLFHATLNLWLEKPFTLVLAQDDSKQEALMIAISCHRETASPDEGSNR